MAISPPLNWDFNLDGDIKFTYKDFAIGGKMVRGFIRVTEHNMLLLNTDHTFKEYLRVSMATQLAEYMISSGLVEFTQMQDNASFDTIVNARCYLAPSDQVKILRVHYNET